MPYGPEKFPGLSKNGLLVPDTQITKGYKPTSKRKNFLWPTITPDWLPDICWLSEKKLLLKGEALFWLQKFLGTGWIYLVVLSQVRTSYRHLFWAINIRKGL